MLYEAKIHRRVTEFVKRQDKKTKQRLKNAIKKRIGDFRIIYEIYDETVYIFVVDVGNRGEIYNRW